jgi:hypothetical protein
VPAPGAETVHDIAYDEALRTIGSQSDVLAELRRRAGTLLAAASLVIRSWAAPFGPARKESGSPLTSPEDRPA